MNNDILVLLATGALILTSITSATGCANKQEALANEPARAAVVETLPVTPALADAEDAKLAVMASPVLPRNPVMDFTGDYSNEKTTLTVEADGAEKAVMTVVLAEDKNTQTILTANTKFDDFSGSLAYENGTKKIVKFDRNGNVVSEKEIYANGTGKIVFGAQKALWTDENEQVSNLVFSFETPESNEAKA